jgi:predicted CopG family antitoxin
MSKYVALDDEAYAALISRKRRGESFSDLIKRIAPRPIKTFGDLERHLENAEGPLFSDVMALRRVKDRKSRANIRGSKNL